MVDMGITKFWICAPKSRSVNNSLQRPNFGVLNKFHEPSNTIIIYPQQVSSSSIIKYIIDIHHHHQRQHHHISSSYTLIICHHVPYMPSPKTKLD